MADFKNDLFRVLEIAQQNSGTPGAGSRTSGANMGGGGLSGTPRGFGGIGIGVVAGVVLTGESLVHVTEPVDDGTGVVSTRNILFWNMDNWDESNWG